MTGILLFALMWVDGAKVPLEGAPFGAFTRLPTDIRELTNPEIRSMSGQTSGMKFRFRTDSKTVAVRWSLTDPDLHGWNMSPPGKSGVDIYEEEGSRYMATGIPTGRTNNMVRVTWNPEKTCVIHLPLFNGLSSIEVGIDEDARIRPAPTYRSGVRKPVVFYGGSIVHGACASRPGMSWVNTVGRLLDVPVVDLGFSGEGKMEPELIEALSRIDASAYVISPFGNMTRGQSDERYERGIRRLRELRPDTPIILGDHCYYLSSRDWKHDAADALYAKLKAEGWKRLHFVDMKDMWPEGDTDGTVDGGHPNDYGARRMARAFAEGVRRALGILPVPEGVPELMTTFAGEKVTTREAWEKIRKPEIRKFFLESMYGVRPAAAERPDVSFEPAEPDRVMMNDKAVRKMTRIVYRGPYGTNSFVVKAFIPRIGRPVPSFVLICNRDPKKNLDPERIEKSPFWPAEEIVKRGYAAIAFFNGDVAKETYNPATAFLNGVFPCYERPEDREDMSWGVLSAWAWGASRVMDWIETEPLLDAKHVGVVGHSRGGKTSLLAGATDERFAMTCVNCSGCGGAKLVHIDLPKSEYYAIFLHSRVTYWFCGKFQRVFMNHDRPIYRSDAWPLADTPLNVDQHEWAALVAPRLLAIASATEDDGAGPLGEWWTAKLASPAWALYGKRGLVGEAWPRADTPQQDGSVSYHLRAGEHTLSLYDWTRYMDFADAHGWKVR